jgi:uncharacterized protein (DUF885 family)
MRRCDGLRGARPARLFDAALVALVACGGAPAPPAPAGVGASAGVPGSADPDAPLAAALSEAADGVDHAALGELLRDHWRWTLEGDPLRATRLGVRAFDDRIADNRWEQIVSRRRERAVLLGRARRIAAEGHAGGALTARDGVTVALLIEQLAADVASEVCDFEQWNLSPRSNPLVDWNELPEVHRVVSVRDGERLRARYRLIAGSIDNDVALLERGLARGLLGNAESIRRIVEMLDRQLAKPSSEWPLSDPARAEHPDWPPAALAAHRTEIAAVVERAIKPALARYRALLAERLLPRARGEDASGVSALPMGQACYRARIRDFTTLRLEARAVHARGLEEIARTDAELGELGRRALGTGSLGETLARLRSDASLYFASEDEVEEAARATLAEAKDKTPAFFGIVPRADCVVRRIPDYEAPFTTIAYYRPAHTDGTKPGEYFVNVFEPHKRPRFEARVLAVHEAVPGHHLQIAIAQELRGMPAFRKHGSFTPYVEGWALYTERLAAEMGLYRDDLDRIGVASFDAWRAARLVVDTGIHALGWSRPQARRYLEEHTALAPGNVDNEVDRYITWPGQALGYKIGQLEIWALRREAEQALGARFRVADFHDAVLGIGPVSLPVLRDAVRAYVARVLRRRTSP